MSVSVIKGKRLGVGMLISKDSLTTWIMENCIINETEEESNQARVGLPANNRRHICILCWYGGLGNSCGHSPKDLAVWQYM